MNNEKNFGATFDTVAADYDQIRPGYVSDIYSTIFDYIPIGENSRVIEVGSGTGQATEPVLKTGCELTAVEYGVNLSEVLKAKFRDYQNFHVVTARFEDAELEEDAYDLVFSATAFHWVPEEIGYPKLYSILKKGGAFARFANRPRNCRDNPELGAEIQELYSDYYDRHHGARSGTKAWFTEEKAKEISRIPEKYGFTDIRYHLFYRERVLTAREYIQLLGTYSDHIAIGEEIRNEFFSKIWEAINRHGGTITINDTLDLELARK